MHQDLWRSHEVRHSQTMKCHPDQVPHKCSANRLVLCRRGRHEIRIACGISSSTEVPSSCEKEDAEEAKRKKKEELKRKKAVSRTASFKAGKRGSYEDAEEKDKVILEQKKSVRILHRKEQKAAALEDSRPAACCTTGEEERDWRILPSCYQSRRVVPR